MKRNCNLELRLVTPSSTHYHSTMDDKHKEKLTIFYNGRVAVCDATELQARAIISLASSEMDWIRLDPISPLPTSPIYSPTTNGLSMKRSLTRFLQKRKTRAEATSPYPINNSTLNEKN